MPVTESAGRRRWPRAALLALAVTLAAKQPAPAADSLPVAPVHAPAIRLFPLSAVSLLDGPFKQVMELDHRYLLSLDPDRLLALYRRTAGLRARARPYPSWESEDVFGSGPLAGHTLGFYLSGLAMMYQATGDSALLQRIRYTLAELSQCQRAVDDGYLLAYSGGQRLFSEVGSGNFTVTDATIQHSWEPVYTMNKVMLGLYRVYTGCHISLAAALMVKMADYFGDSVVDKLSRAGLQKLLIAEHGSISESFVNAYQVTGKKKYLRWAERLHDERMLGPAAAGKDILNGWHANTQISKFTGFENVFDYTGDETYTAAARYFWKTVVSRRSWVIGGNSVEEHFFPTDDFDQAVLTAAGPESCNSVHMMRLTEALYRDYGEPGKIAFYERVLFNHILANYDPETGTSVYYTTMRPGGYKVYGVPLKSFWCCSGTGLFAAAKFGKMIYAHDSAGLYVNLFMHSRVRWPEKGVTLTQITRFPDEQQTRLALAVDRPATFTLRIRYPRWVTGTGLKITVNGKPVEADASPGTYQAITRTWRTGDTVSVQLPARVHVAMLPGTSRFVSVMYGPVVLAAKVDNHGLQRADFRSATQTRPVRELPLSVSPFFTGDVTDIENHIIRQPGRTLSFSTPADGGDTLIALLPFYRIHFSRYSVYFPRYDDRAAYREILSRDSRERQLLKSILAATIDSVATGEAASEELHALQAQHSRQGVAYGRGWRDAAGGFFQYRMKVLPGKRSYLFVVFAGSDAGARAFDVLVDGRLLKHFDHARAATAYAGKLYGCLIPLGATLPGEDHITVEFRAGAGEIAGGVFGLRTIDMDKVLSGDGLSVRTLSL